jgi:hypothetical protein
VTVSGAALRTHEKRIAGMLADPDLVGDLLLVGIVFARSVDLDDPPLNQVVKGAAKAVYGAASHSPALARFRWEDHPRAHDQGTRRVRDVLRTDIRRYVPDLSKAHTCQRPIVRRRPPVEAGMVSLLGPPPVVYGGTPPPAPERETKCGRAAEHGREAFVDPVDGTRTVLGACGQARCRMWWQALHDANRRELEAHPPPEPVANRGGVLERHLDEIDWPALYQHLDPKWKPPHEAPGWRPPKLQVVLTDDPVPVTAAVRPALTVLKGGWR